ncbi:MAG: PPC domain-containing protein [Halobacteriota archaeon]
MISTRSTLALLLALGVVAAVPVAVATGDDSLEPNDSPSTAAEVTSPNTYTGLTASTQDRDWYALSLAAGDTITVYVNVTNGHNGNAVLGIWNDSNGDGSVSNRITYANKYAQNETVTFTAATAGTYYVDVSVSAGSSIDYELGLAGEATGGSGSSDDGDSGGDGSSGDGSNDSSVFTAPIPGVGGQNPPTDTDGDGKYDDVNGDGKATFGDAIALAFADTSGLSAQQTAALDFDDDGDADFEDAIALAFL